MSVCFIMYLSLSNPHLSSILGIDLISELSRFIKTYLLPSFSSLAALHKVKVKVVLKFSQTAIAHPQKNSIGRKLSFSFKLLNSLCVPCCGKSSICSVARPRETLSSGALLMKMGYFVKYSQIGKRCSFHSQYLVKEKFYQFSQNAII